MELKLLSIVVQSLLLVVTHECETWGGMGSACGHGRATSCYRSHCTCSCDSGWAGDCCEIPPNHCYGDSCKHGNCQNGIHSFSCSCDGGYSGYHCDTDINECSSNPCQNSGVCHDYIDRYSCTCSPGFTGTYCETEINECVSNPCHHSGVCHDFVNRYLCTCKSGYTGKNCELEINECASNPCQHSGVCHDFVNRYSCTCKSGYTGKNCELDINDCASNPCQHQASCIDHLSSYTCRCTVGYTGKHCEMNIECHSNPCQNGGICTDDQNTGHTCHCPLGFTGKNCEKAPSIMIRPNISVIDTKTVLEGSNVLTIPCYAEGIPVPSVTWESLDKPILPHNARQLAHYLVFENVSSIDGGHYVCTAKNRVGMDITVVQVIVKAGYKKPHEAPSIHAPATIKVKYYTEARITCTVTGFPIPTVTWIHNNVPLKFTGNTMVIHSVTNVTTGTYKCIANNDAGTSQANIQLKVTYDVPKIVSPPLTSVIMAGQAHNFTCIATGHPEPTIIWTYKMFTKHTTDMPSHQLYKHDSVLTLYSMNTQESGLLTCSAQNEFGEDHVSVSVIVRSPNPFG